MCTRTRALIHPTRVAVLRRIFPPVLALVAALPLSAQSSELGDAFARMDKTAQQFKGITADIKRDVYTVVINDHERDSGTIEVKREKHETRMLIEFTGPDAKTVSLDGSTLSIYYPKINTVQVYDVGSKRDLVDQFLLLGFGASSTELKTTYAITFLGTEMIGSETTWHLQLVPKSADILKNLKKAELWIAETSGLPAQQKFVTSSTGDYNLVMYSNTRFNPPLPDSALKLHYPKGATVEHPRL